MVAVRLPSKGYPVRFLFMAKGSAPALGIARHAIDAVIEGAAGTPARRYAIGEQLESAKLLRDAVYVQEAVGRAETLLAAPRAYHFDVMDDLSGTPLNGR